MRAGVNLSTTFITRAGCLHIEMKSNLVQERAGVGYEAVIGGVLSSVFVEMTSQHAQLWFFVLVN